MTTTHQLTPVQYQLLVREETLYQQAIQRRNVALEALVIGLGLSGTVTGIDGDKLLISDGQPDVGEQSVPPLRVEA